MNPALSNYEETLQSRRSRAKPRLSLSKEEKLRHNRQFGEVYIRGRRLSGPHLTIIFLSNQLKFNRLGLSVSKRRFKLSVRRHYIQRRLREAYRLNKMRFLPGYDIIISARRFAQPLRAKVGFNKDNFRFDDIKAELLSLAQKARLLKSDEEHTGK